jgi:hypothetical protein
MSTDDKYGMDLKWMLELGRLMLDMVKDLEDPDVDVACCRRKFHFPHGEVELFLIRGADAGALTLSPEELDLLQEFRRFKPHVRNNGQLFKWPTTKPEGEQPAKAKRKRRA